MVSYGLLLQNWMLQSREVFGALSGELADRPYPERAGKQLLLKLANSGMWGPPGISIEPSTV